MAPLTLLTYPLATIGIGGIYSLWKRMHLQQITCEKVRRERVAYLLWTVAQRT